jgi:cohesin complex subunit SA-1/2
VVSTFGRAIRTGVIDIARSVVLLAHYGQLGVVFDQWVKVIVEVLREEGMYNGNGQAVVDIVTRSLEEVSATVPYW